MKNRFKKYVGNFFLVIVLLGTLQAQYACQKSNIHQKNSDINKLLLESKETQIYLLNFLNQIKKKYQNSTVFDPGVKEMETIGQLLKTRWNNDASKICDYARATICVETVLDVYRCLTDIFNSDLNVIETFDHFIHPYKTGYRNIAVFFEDPNNEHIGEIQISTIPIVNYNTLNGHSAFDTLRHIEANVIVENRIFSDGEKEEIKNIVETTTENFKNAFCESMKINENDIRLGVYGIIINNKKEVLLKKNLSEEKNIYSFPGNVAKYHESFSRSLSMELAEKLQDREVAQKFFYFSNKFYINEDFPDTSMPSLYFLIEIKDANLESKLIDNLDFKWFPMDNLPIQATNVDLEAFNRLQTTNEKLELLRL